MADAIEERIISYMRSIGFLGDILFGGSRQVGERTAYSDIDCYLIAPTVVSLVRLLQKKKAIQLWVASQDLPISFICVPQIAVDWKLYYIAAVYKDGTVPNRHVDQRLMRNTALKVAYRERGYALFDLPEKEGYHLSKVLINAVYAVGLSRGVQEATKQPLFTATGAMKVLGALEKVEHRGTVTHVLEARIQRKTIQVTAEVREAVDTWVDTAWHAYQTGGSLSWRSYLLYTLFSFRYPRLYRFLLGNPDTYILRQIRKAIQMHNQALFARIAKDTFQILII